MTQKIDHSVRDEYETKTRELFADYIAKTEWDSSVRVVAMVFEAMSHTSLTAERIQRIGEAMAAYTSGSWDPQIALTRLTRAKVLRSRMHGGKRFYEVNY